MNRGSLLILSLLWVACASAAPNASRAKTAKPARAASAPAATPTAVKSNILIVRKNSTDYTFVADQIRIILAGRNWSEFFIDRTTPFESFQKRIESDRPTLLVLMDNQALEFAKRLNDARPAAQRIRGVALMGLNLKAALKGRADFAGVAFEAPAFSIFTQFRFLLEKPIKTIAVYYRESVLGDEIRQAEAQLRPEGFALRAINLESAGAGAADVERELRSRFRIGSPDLLGADAVWLPLDSALLTPALFMQLWQPVTSKLTIPLVTSAENLVRPEARFATFAVVPDLHDLASQAAQMIESLEGGGAPAEIGVEDVISVRKLLNESRATDLELELRREHLGEVEVR